MSEFFEVVTCEDAAGLEYEMNAAHKERRVVINIMSVGSGYTIVTMPAPQQQQVARPVIMPGGSNGGLR